MASRGIASEKGAVRMEAALEGHDGSTSNTPSNDDNMHMARLGKKQELDRNFELVSITAFSVIATGGWIFVPNSALYGLVDGNTGGTITMFLINFALFSTIILSLAEMSSMAPTAGAQYHWASEFAPQQLQKPLSYTAGWLSSLSWCCGTTSGFFLSGNLIQAVIVEMNPQSYTATAWKAYLMVLAIALLGALVNVFLSRRLPQLENLAFAFTLVGFISIIIVLWVLGSDDKLTGAQVFQTFENNGGWSSLGLSMLAGQILMVWCLTGADATAHMAEETRNASSVIPKAMLWSYILNGLMVCLMLITYCFCLTNLDEAFKTPTGYPFLEVFANTTGSAAGGTGLTCVIILLICFSVTNYMAATSRQVFAFARDKGLPFSTWISRVDSRTQCPTNAVAVTFCFAILISLISLGSSTAFNAITSLQLLALVFTYLVTIGSLIFRRLYGNPLPIGSWSLGRLGLPTNVLACVYSLYLVVFIPFPTELPVTLATVNWSPVMFVGVIALALVYYVIYARKTYDGPVAYVGAMY